MRNSSSHAYTLSCPSKEEALALQGTIGFSFHFILINIIIFIICILRLLLIFFPEVHIYHSNQNVLKGKVFHILCKNYVGLCGKKIVTLSQEATSCSIPVMIQINSSLGHELDGVAEYKLKR